MTVTLTTRFGMTRWSSDEDPWSREELDANFGAIEALAAQAVQGLNADRPAAGTQRRFYLATDAERVYLDDGDEWHEFLVLGTGGTVAGSVDFTGTNALRNGVAIATTDDVGAVTTALGDHVTDATAAHAASAIGYAGSAGLSATDVEAALDELDTEKANATDLTAHVTDTTAAHAASAIGNTPAGSIVATDVQAAIDELDTEKAALAGATFTGLVTFNGGAAIQDGDDVTIGTSTGTKIGQPASKIGFYGATPIGRPGTYNLSGPPADRTLGAYSSDAESAAYTGIDNTQPGTVYAQVTDLNALRTAYETLRAFVEDLGGVVVGTATDLKDLGLVG